MSAMGFDPGALGDVLSSLGAEDLSALQGMAASLFSGAGQGAKAEPRQSASGAGETEGFGMPDFESVAKIAALLELLQTDRSDPRANLLLALRPLLSEQRRPRVDQAVRMLQLFSLLPKIKELM